MIYVKLKKAQYKIMQAVLRVRLKLNDKASVWQKKIINGKQCTMICRT